MITVHELYTALSQRNRDAEVTVKNGAIYVGDEALTEEDANEAVTTVLQREAVADMQANHDEGEGAHEPV